MNRPPVDELCQLAAAAGADEVLDDEESDDEVLDELPDDESDLAGSLAVLPPPRESVR